MYHDVAGDGIVPINTTDAMVEYNLVDNSADSSWNYSANPEPCSNLVMGQQQCNIPL